MAKSIKRFLISIVEILKDCISSSYSFDHNISTGGVFEREAPKTDAPCDRYINDFVKNPLGVPFYPGINPLNDATGTLTTYFTGLNDIGKPHTDFKRFIGEIEKHSKVFSNSPMYDFMKKRKEDIYQEFIIEYIVDKLMIDNCWINEDNNK